MTIIRELYLYLTEIILISFRFLWPCIAGKVWRERKPTRCTNQMFIINFCLNMFRASLCSSSEELPTTQRPTTSTSHIQQKQSSTPYAVTHSPCSPEDGHNDARNMLRQKLIINIWLLHLVGFLSLYTMLILIIAFVLEFHLSHSVIKIWLSKSDVANTSFFAFHRMKKRVSFLNIYMLVCLCL